MTAAQFLARLNCADQRQVLEPLAGRVVFDGLKPRIASEDHLGQLRQVALGVWRREGACEAALRRERASFEAALGRRGSPAPAFPGSPGQTHCLAWEQAESTIRLCCTQLAPSQAGAEWMSLTAVRSFGPELPVDVTHGFH